VQFFIHIFSIYHLCFTGEIATCFALLKKDECIGIKFGIAIQEIFKKQITSNYEIRIIKIFIVINEEQKYYAYELDF